MPRKVDHQRRKFLKTALSSGALALSLPSISLASATSNPAGTASTADTTDDGKDLICLFQGDSITDGNRTRNNDWNHVMGHGYAYLIASRLWYDHPSKNFHFFNRGISGNKVSDLAARWQTDTLDLKPNLLSILIGVNDLNSMFNNNDPHPVTAADYETGYRSLLQTTKTQLPSTRIVICEPFLLPVGRVKDNWQAWSTEMQTRQAIAKKLATETDALFIPLQDAFNKSCTKAPAEYWIWDGIHPMPAGHELMARQWIRVVGKEFSFIR